MFKKILEIVVLPIPAITTYRSQSYLLIRVYFYLILFNQEVNWITPLDTVIIENASVLCKTRIFAFKKVNCLYNFSSVTRFI